MTNPQTTLEKYKYALEKIAKGYGEQGHSYGGDDAREIAREALIEKPTSDKHEQN